MFFDNGGFGQTELQTILQEHDINTLYITGLARDYCVYFTAKDSQRLGKLSFSVERKVLLLLNWFPCCKVESKSDNCQDFN